jgi:ribosomal protein S18 acetylase RimI-like enzyme
MFKSTNQLTEAQLNDLEQLRIRCKKIDGSTPNLYTHILAKPRALPASLMCYEKNRLVGFLSAFFFYDDAVEIALLVEPKFRKRGIAKQLLSFIIPLIQSHGLINLIFSSPSHLNDTWLPALGLSSTHSEYYMERNALIPIRDVNQDLVIRKANLDDITLLGALDEACFPKKTNEFIDRFRNLLEDKNYLIFLGFQNDCPIGKAHMRWDKKGATLSDIAIFPEVQGKGYGTTLIAHCTNLALSKRKPQVCLDVETHNERALHLYTRLGFFVQNACDYWTISVNELLKRK